MLTKDILFGMNLVTLAGFVVMGLTLTLNLAGTNAPGLGRWGPCERHAQLLIASPPLGLRCRISREPRPLPNLE